MRKFTLEFASWQYSPARLWLWTLECAVEFLKTNLNCRTVFFSLRCACIMRGSATTDSTRSVLVERVRGHELLEKQLANLLDPPIHPAEMATGAPCSDAFLEHDEEDKLRQEEWIDFIRANVDALRENRAAPKLLHHLAEAYYGELPTWSSSITGEQRIREQLGNDEDLTKAALSGLRETVLRDDVPESRIIDGCGQIDALPCVNVSCRLGRS